MLIALKEEAAVKTALVIVSLTAATLAVATPTTAGVRPYVRGAYGGSQLQVDNINEMIADDEQALRDGSGYPIELERVGHAFGPEVSAGAWLTPWVRVGATYVNQKATTENDLGINHETTGYRYTDILEFRTEEVGGEIVVRVERLGGLCLGGQAASGRARFSENFSESDFSSEYHLSGTAERTRVTWAAFIGLDRTNEQGVAGFLRGGYRFRNYGPMPARVTESDGSTSTTYDTTTIPLDYSGFFVSLGVGYDFRW